MPEHIRALIVIFALSLLVSFCISGPLSPLTRGGDGRRLRNWWLFATCAAFSLHSVWLYFLAIVCAVVFTRPSRVDRLTGFLVILFAVPAASIDLPGMGLVNYIFSINNIRFLLLVLLAPILLRAASDGQHAKIGALPTDKWVISFVMLASVLQFRSITVTDGLRGAFCVWLDIFVPYYAFSRAARSRGDALVVVGAYIRMAAILGALALFELFKGWNLYATLPAQMGLTWKLGGYSERDGMLRAAVSAGQPLVYGFAMAIAGGFLFFVRKDLRSRYGSIVLAGLIFGGLLASLSRGPWIGVVVILFSYSVLEGRPVLRLLSTVFFAGFALLALASLFSFGQRFINLLPFVGQVDAYNVTYRQMLIENSMVVIARNFWFGSVDYLSAPEMQVMIQGEGIIDVVNTYIGVVFDYGVIGLFLFVMVFVSSGVSVYKASRGHAVVNDVDFRLGCVLLASVIGVAVMIFTVSSIAAIPVLYWSLIGLCAAYAGFSKSSTPATPKKIVAT